MESCLSTKSHNIKIADIYTLESLVNLCHRAGSPPEAFSQLICHQ
jgi:hypothetical protein